MNTFFERTLGCAFGKNFMFAQVFKSLEHLYGSNSISPRFSFYTVPPKLIGTATAKNDAHVLLLAKKAPLVLLKRARLLAGWVALC